MNKNLIVIDPGHGGQDSGAVAASGLEEKAVALAHSLALAGRLSMAGFPVHLTRTADEFLTLTTRAVIANDVGAALFLSIHANAHGSSRPQGFEVWTTPGTTDADRCATEIWNSMRDQLPHRRARLDQADGDPDFEANFAVLRKTIAPAVLVELGFMSHPEEAEIISRVEFINQATAAISDGVRNYFKGDVL